MRSARGRRGVGCALASVLLMAMLASPAAARKERLELELLQVQLPGAPAAIVPADVDGDGIGDLVVAVAYTKWGQVTVSDTVEMDEVGGLVEMMTIVPALADERRLLVFLGREDGGFEALGEPSPLPVSVLSLEAGPPGFPVVALVDDGLDVLRVDPSAEPHVRFERVLDNRPVVRGSGALLPRLELVTDLDGDGHGDLLFPERRRIAVYLYRGGGYGEEPDGYVALPPRRSLGSGFGDFELLGERGSSHRFYPLPVIEDVDGDSLPDLLFPHPDKAWQQLWVARNRGGGRFSPLVAPLGEEPDDWIERAVTVSIGTSGSSDETPEAPVETVAHFGDVDGDGRGEYIRSLELFDPDAGFRKYMKQAKNPRFRYRIHDAQDDLAQDAEARYELTASGYAFLGNGDEFPLPGGLQDLDGDGRQDLVAITLDFSLLQVVRLAATRSLSLGLDFHVYCQRRDGTFGVVDGLDLSGKFKIDFDDLRLGQLSQFAGDFDGDGRRDFVQIGRGKTVGIHRGQAGCRYPSKPDLTLRLEDEPKNLALVRVADFDSDGLSDLLVVQPQRGERDGSSSPVRLDLYSSRRSP